MRVAVEDGVDPIPVDRLFQTARTEKGEDLRRFPFDGASNRRVMQQGNTLLRSQPRERCLEFQRLIDGFLHERLDRVLAPRTERTTTEAARKSLDAGEADSVHFRRLAIKHTYSAIDENLTDFLWLATLIVVVAEHRNHGNLDHAKLAHQDTRLIRQAVVGKVATQQQHIRRVVDLRKKRLKSTLGIL